jgi:hypothetical protein
LEAFDELEEIGLEEFTRKHDPYWDIALNENLPQPAIELAVHGQTGSSLGPLFDGVTAKADVPVQSPARGLSATAVFPSQPVVLATVSTGTTDAFTTITKLLHSRGVITSSDAQQATGLDAPGVRPHLQQLVQQGLAVTEGQRRGMRYRRLDG